MLIPNEQNYNYNIEGFGQNENQSIIASSDYARGASFINSQNGKLITTNLNQKELLSNNIRNQY